MKSFTEQIAKWAFWFVVLTLAAAIAARPVYEVFK